MSNYFKIIHPITEIIPWIIILILSDFLTIQLCFIEKQNGNLNYQRSFICSVTIEMSPIRLSRKAFRVFC